MLFYTLLCHPRINTTLSNKQLARPLAGPETAFLDVVILEFISMYIAVTARTFLPSHCLNTEIERVERRSVLDRVQIFRTPRLICVPVE